MRENRLCGSEGGAAEPNRPSLPLSRTNITKLTAETPLMPSGLLGPVRLQVEKQ